MHQMSGSVDSTLRLLDLADEGHFPLMSMCGDWTIGTNRENAGTLEGQEGESGIRHRLAPTGSPSLDADPLPALFPFSRASAIITARWAVAFRALSLWAAPGS
jgi:hypothetical protein